MLVPEYTFQDDLLDFILLNNFSFKLKSINWSYLVDLALNFILEKVKVILVILTSLYPGYSKYLPNLA